MAGSSRVASAPANLVVRPAVGRLAFEGLALYPNGVLFYGDEKRTLNGNHGSAYLKFVHAMPGRGGTISSLDQSPLAAGAVYGLRLGKFSGNTDYGQGTNAGMGTWVPIVPSLNADL